MSVAAAKKRTAVGHPASLRAVPSPAPAGGVKREEGEGGPVDPVARKPFQRTTLTALIGRRPKNMSV
jgi:hypothetical protein